MNSTETSPASTIPPVRSSSPSLRPGLDAEFHFGGWEPAAAWVRTTFPTAVHSGMGYFKIPRTARFFYSCGSIRVEMMHRKTLADIGL